MAQFFYNPSDYQYQLTCYLWKCFCNLNLDIYGFMMSVVFNLVEGIIWMLCLTPDMYFYWTSRLRMWCRQEYLSWMWWIILLYAYWEEPYWDPKQGDKYPGTYWNRVELQIHHIKAELKELARERRRLERDNRFAHSYRIFWHHLILHPTMLFLNFVALGYFVARIFFYKVGFISPSKKQRRPWKKRKQKDKLFHAHSTVLNIDKRLQEPTMSFDSDTKTVICDNSANVHICNDESMFVGPIRRTDKHYVATIGGKQNNASGMGTVRWTWKDDAGKKHTIDLENVLYFPQSPVNILSVTSLADQLEDDQGTGIDTKRFNSRFYWNHGKFSRTINHGPSRLPELPINEGFFLSGLFSKLAGKKVCLDKKHCHCHASHLIPNDDIDDQPALPLNLSDTMFHVGETLLYTNAGHTIYARVEKIFLDDNAVLRIQIRTSEDELIDTTKESLRSPDSPDIGWIPTTIPEKKTAASNLTKDEVTNLSDPVTLSPLQEEFLALHERLWHLPFSTMFRLVKLGFLPAKFRKLNNKAPPCVSCLFGQAHRKPWQFKKTKDGSKTSLRGDKISKPGQTVGIDQLISAQPGLVPQAKGMLTRARIWAATVFIDYATGFVHVGLQQDQSGDATLQAKSDFEHLCNTRDVKVKQYHADNGRFAEHSFTDDVKKNGQRITYCAVGAHHQNGITENTIKQLTLISRTLLLHAQDRWPEYISTMLWPFALKAAQDRMNQINVDLSGRTPDMKFSGVAAANLRLRDMHTFGCPCYVLDSRLQTNPKGVPKWEPRARLGIYVGRSPNHAGNVALVLNPKTGLVSPQYHVVFDDDFTTVPHLRKGTVPPNWAKLVASSRERSTTEFYDLTKTWFAPTSDESAGETFNNPTNIEDEGEAAEPIAAINANEGVGPIPVANATEGSDVNVNEGVKFSSTSTTNVETVSATTSVTQDSEGDVHDLCMPEMIDLETAGHRRSERLKSQPRNKYSMFSRFCAFGLLLGTSLSQPATAFSHAQASVNSVIHQCNVINANFDGSLNQIHHMVLAASKSNNETYTFREMLKQDDSHEFIKAMEKEVKDHESRGHWEVVERSTLPSGIKTIQAIWSFRRKRFPDGTLNKFKARLCAHGGMQQWGVNYWETYAPVVNWISVRFLLILTELAGLESRAIDFVLAFPQADLDVPVYMELPIGMEVSSGNSPQKPKQHLLRLRKSLYGLKQASANWHEYLKKGLQLRGFDESVADPCVFFKGTNVQNGAQVTDSGTQVATSNLNGKISRTHSNQANRHSHGNPSDGQALNRHPHSNPPDGQALNRHPHGNPPDGQALSRYSHGNPHGQALNRHPHGNPPDGQALSRYSHGNPHGQALNRPSDGNSHEQALDASPTENAIARFKNEASNVIVLVYVDDCIIIGQDNLSIDLFIESLTHGPEKFAFTDEGSIDKYLGVNIERLPDNNGFTISQPHLIQRILEAAHIDLRMTNSRPTPVVGPLLSRDEDGPDRKHEWKYRTLTGMLEYLQVTSRPDISMATHQCARFNANPKLCHERAVKRICKYLLGTMDKGLVYRPDPTKGLECHVDADFAGGWTIGETSNPEVLLSRTGFVISYAGCPIFWRSKLQTEIALSTTESEYIALSMAMREVLPFLNLMNELRDIIPMKSSEPKFYCKVWEDNRSCIKVAESPKFTPRTKHIALKYHHFRQFVSDGTIRIHPIDTLEQVADILTKPLDGVKFSYLRKKLCGW